MPGFHLTLATPLLRKYELCVADASKIPRWTSYIDQYLDSLYSVIDSSKFCKPLPSFLMRPLWPPWYSTSSDPQRMPDLHAAWNCLQFSILSTSSGFPKLLPSSQKLSQHALNLHPQRGSKRERNPYSVWLTLSWPGWDSDRQAQPSTAFILPAQTHFTEDPKTPYPSPAGCLLGVAAVGFCTHCFLLGPPMLLQTDPNCSEVVPVQDFHNRLLYCFHFLCF